MANTQAGFITVDQAIALINSDQRTDAKVDTAFLLRNLPYLREDGNYTIRKMKHSNGRVVDDGVVYVHIANTYEKSILEHAIVEHYKDVSGRRIDVDSIGLRKITTAVDDEKNPAGRAMVNKTSSIKAGDDLGSGTQNVAE